MLQLRTGLVALLGACLFATACGKDKETILVQEQQTADQVYYFSGHIYDGLTGQRLTGYSLDLQFRDKKLSAQVDAEGRYFVGPLPYFQDYTVRVKADGYRSFLSHNAGITLDWNHESFLVHEHAPEKGFYYNAFLYPDDLVAPATQVFVTTWDTEKRPSGTVRFTPTNVPAMLDYLPAVNGQIWNNADDLQLRTVTKTVTDGVATIEAGELGFGVHYDVMVYGAAGYAPGIAGFLAGIDDYVTVVLDPLDAAGLELVYNSITTGIPAPNGEIVLAFNQPIEFDPLHTAAEYAKYVDDTLSIDSWDENGNGKWNELKNASRGTAVQIKGNLLILRWNPQEALATVDDNDPIYSVTYGALDSVLVRPAGGKYWERASIGMLVGTTSLTVNLR
ncbi:hypothetical protein [Vulgatibacter incomptus]|uniref:hypothetical protein n=1 Tax=Vulgatibacter incomptus TaxID=1391653 RepID=UPI0012FCA239|nr:hypothetical protein [Vulgatibacter incomptus]